MLLIAEKPSHACSIYWILAMVLFVIVLLFVVWASCKDKRDLCNDNVVECIV